MKPDKQFSISPLQFHFDFISPYGYFASLRIEALAERHGRTVDWHTMLLGVSVLKVMGLKPLMDTPLKGAYTGRDVLRHARETPGETLGVAAFSVVQRDAILDEVATAAKVPAEQVVERIAKLRDDAKTGATKALPAVVACSCR